MEVAIVRDRLGVDVALLILVDVLEGIEIAIGSLVIDKLKGCLLYTSGSEIKACGDGDHPRG